MGNYTGEQGMHLYVTNVLNMVEKLFDNDWSDETISIIENSCSYAKKIDLEKNKIVKEKTILDTEYPIVIFPDCTTTKKKVEYFKWEIEDRLNKMKLDLDIVKNYVLLGKRK